MKPPDRPRNPPPLNPPPLYPPPLYPPPLYPPPLNPPPLNPPLAAAWNAKTLGPRVVVLDNYDSFIFNIVQYLGELGADLQVFRNDAVSVAQVKALEPDGILLGPGPGGPLDAGITLDLLAELVVPMLGVCLGHQSMVHAAGGSVVRAERLMHGRISPIHHDGQGIFASIPSPFEATRYHSLIAERASLPACYEVTASTAEDEIMGIRHKTAPFVGVQFHPESFLTQHGHVLIGNWLRTLPRGDQLPAGSPRPGSPSSEVPEVREGRGTGL